MPDCAPIGGNAFVRMNFQGNPKCAVPSLEDETMLKLVEMDEQVTFARQLECNTGPIVIINIFTVAAEDAEQLVRACTPDANFLKQQRGFVSAQLHRGVGGSDVFANYAVWESIEDFRRAFFNPNFQSTLEEYPRSAVASPHVFQKLAVPGVCADR